MLQKVTGSRMILGIIMFFIFSSCVIKPGDTSDPEDSPRPVVDANIIIDGARIITQSYLGNGAQWDPYQLDYGKVNLSISEADWKKIYDRLDFMRPQVMRVMINTVSAMEGDTLNVQKGLEQLLPILEYCQSRDVTVTFGDWGGRMVDSKADTISERHLEYAAKYLDFLVNDKGFSCIKYYNMINEPNGFWSVTDESYTLWRDATAYFQEQLESRGLTNKVSIMGPDIAIWDTDETDWISRTERDLGEAVGLYDIHTYPSKSTVNSGEYSEIIRAYKEEAPDDVPIIMGEIGFKFVAEEDKHLNEENIVRAEAKPYASVEDSQMFVYDHVYGTDMADALFQTVNEGYSGCVVWMLDDAMHSKEERHKLKVWGFWNILGEEFFGAEEEAVRPWFYAWSLLTKYMPSGSRIIETVREGDESVKAISLEKDGSHMLAIVNVGKEKKHIKVSFENLPNLEGMKKFIYSEDLIITEGDHKILPNETGLKINSAESLEMEITPETLIVLTNFTY
ncbi:hypothetical protein OQ279_06815 [Salinimicrobium sp. MT39]|jgi:hypothetical protein|uniref:Glycoside hydrolase family 5 domain-containing protein n=1 Tax=Salinimicrobium profundisediminis TaxID=2994553 RepID=A0A9X3I1E7_9FLAO|nr:hypothetical protein [Salinimicrobium profundisediminis]MCX2837862.1 hypothetical protein [Salinimicrobium profundisediminis]